MRPKEAENKRVKLKNNLIINLIASNTIYKLIAFIYC